MPFKHTCCVVVDTTLFSYISSCIPYTKHKIAYSVPYTNALYAITAVLPNLSIYKPCICVGMSRVLLWTLASVGMASPASLQRLFMLGGTRSASLMWVGRRVERHLPPSAARPPLYSTWEGAGGGGGGTLNYSGGFHHLVLLMWFPCVEFRSYWSIF